MSFGSYVAGLLRLAGVVVPAVVAARSARRLLAAGSTIALGGLIDVVLALSLVTVASEALGTFGQFHAAPLIATLWVAAAATVGARRRLAPHRRPAGAAPSAAGGVRRPGETVAVAGAAALVAAMWSTWVANAVDFGVGDSDSNWYHLPFAARFVQTGFTTHAQFVNAEPLVTYYPADGSLLHAVGMVAFRTDALSVVLNLALVPAALLAAWCLGEGSGHGPASLIGVAIVLTVPVIASSQAGSANDDLLSTLGLLAAAAFAVHPDLRGPARWKLSAVLAGCAAGLAVGTKLTTLLPVAVLLVGLVAVAGGGRRWGTAWRAALAILVTGGFWYGRDLALVGSPIPSLRLGVGGLHLPRPPTPSVDTFGSTLSQHLSDAGDWQHIFLPGAAHAFGIAWFVIIAVALVGMALAVRSGRHAIVAVAGLAAAAGYLFTPGSAYGTEALAAPGARSVVTNIFAYNLRYLLPALALGLALLPVAAARLRWGTQLVLPAFGAVLLATELGAPGHSAWASGHAPVAVAVAVGVFAALVLGLGGLRSGTAGRHAGGRGGGGPRPAARRALLAGGLVIAVAGASWPVQVRYRSHRFAGSALAHWAASVPGARIAYDGFDLSYDLYGPHLANRVQYLGQRAPHGAWHPFSSCLAWRVALRAGRYQYLVVPEDVPTTELGYDLSTWRLGLAGGQPPDPAPATIWSRTDPGLRQVATGEGAVVYEVTGPASASGC